MVVDVVPNTLEIVERNLVSEGYEVRTASGVSKAISRLRMLSRCFQPFKEQGYFYPVVHFSPEI